MDTSSVVGIVVGTCVALGVVVGLYLLFPLLRRLVSIPRRTYKEKNANAIRVGVLGAANIAPMALIYPSRKMEDVVIAAVAARSKQKATRFAKKYGIETVHDSYEDMINDDSLDAIYNPLPNGMHAFWTIEALKKGKHVLCEKPLASNKDEVEAMIKAAEEHSPKDGRKDGLLLVEAFHYRFHPLAREINRLVNENVLGNISSVETNFSIPYPFPPKSDIRFDVKGTNSELAGGSLMDAGVYSLNCLRLVCGDQDISVESSKIVQAYEGVDESADVELKCGSGIRGRIKCAFRSWNFFTASLNVQGSKFHLYVYNFLAPFVYHRVVLTNVETKEKVVKKFYENGASTYEYQLRAFIGAIRGDKEAVDLCKFAGSPYDSLINMSVIDMIYKEAGLHPRKGKPLA